MVVAVKAEAADTCEKHMVGALHVSWLRCWVRNLYIGVLSCYDVRNPKRVNLNQKEKERCSR